jgi:hypothetical protein
LKLARVITSARAGSVVVTVAVVSRSDSKAISPKKLLPLPEIDLVGDPRHALEVALRKTREERHLGEQVELAVRAS